MPNLVLANQQKVRCEHLKIVRHLRIILIYYLLAEQNNFLTNLKQTINYE